MPDQTRFSPDKVAAHEFLEALDSDATTWTFQTFDDNYNRKRGSLAKVLHGTLDDHWETLCRYSDRGAGVFVTINETDGKGRKTENIIRVRAVWVDTDGADQAPIEAADPHLIVESSPGNFHDYWLVEGCPLEEFSSAQKTLSEVWGTDAGVKDLSRVMRLPGFPHQKVDSEKGLTGNKFMVRMVGDMSFLGADNWADRKEQIDKCLANKRATDPTPSLSRRALAGIHPPDTCEPTEISFADVGGPSEDEARDLLGYSDPDEPYDLWLSVLMALHSAGDHMLPLAVEWSKRGDKFRPGEIERKWKSFKRGSAVTWRTVPGLARQGGADLSAIARKHGLSGNLTALEQSLSHDALAIEMGRCGFDENARFVSQWGKWVFWNGNNWRIDEHLEHMIRTREFLRHKASEVLALDKKATSTARILRSKTTVAAVESLARSNESSVVPASKFDAKLMLLGTPRGTVNLETGQIRPALREDYITKQTAVAPTAGIAQRWMGFLHEVMDCDDEKVAFLQRLAGYALTGQTSEHKLFFFFGTGRNGKGVFMNTLMALWKDYARKAAATTFLSSRGEKHPTDVAGLQGARLVFGSELPAGKTWDESVIKDLTGGDRMTARLMRQDFFDFDPQLTLIIAGNNQPTIRGVDEAMRSRMVMVPFEVTIPKEKRDPKLQETLISQEGGQILQLAIKGASQWARHGLQVPPSIQAASDEYLEGEDLIAQFIEQETQRDPQGFVTTGDLHLSFNSWMVTIGGHPWTQPTFRKEIAARGYESRKRRQGNGFVGLRPKHSAFSNQEGG